MTLSADTAGVALPDGSLAIRNSSVSINSSLSRADGFYGLAEIGSLSIKDSRVEIKDTVSDEEYYAYGVKLMADCKALALEGVKAYTGDGKAQCSLTKADLYDSDDESYQLDGSYLLFSPENLDVPAGVRDEDPSVTFAKNSLKYSGDAHKPTITVKAKGKAVPASSYEAIWGERPGTVGTHYVNVRLKGIYVGTAYYAEYTITKGDNPLVVKAKTPTFKYAKVKKRSQSVAASKAFSVAGPQGKVTYEKKSGNKKIAVSSAGKITVMKGLKKGAYKVGVRVKAAGNGNYNAAVKSLTLKVLVK